MGHGIHTYFKPGRFFNSIEKLHEHCTLYLSELEPTIWSDTSISFNRWCLSLEFPIEMYGDVSLSYLRLYTQGFMSNIEEETDWRKDISTICRAFGAEEWWTCDECAEDLVVDMNLKDFEMALHTRSIEYADYVKPDSIWPDGCLFVHDREYNPQ